MDLSTKPVLAVTSVNIVRQSLQSNRVAQLREFAFRCESAQSDLYRRVAGTVSESASRKRPSEFRAPAHEAPTTAPWPTVRAGTSSRRTCEHSSAAEVS